MLNLFQSKLHSVSCKPQRHRVIPKVLRWVNFFILCTASESMYAQTGIFASGSHYISPRISQISFDGTTQQSFVVGTSTAHELGGFLTTDGNHLYWSNAASINRTHLQTRVTEELASYALGTFQVVAMTTDGHHLYLADYQSKNISQYGMDGKFVRTIGLSTRYVTGMITDGVYIFWSDEDEGLYRMKIDGTERARILAASGIMGLTADSSHIYWANSRLIQRCGLDGNNPVVLVDQPLVFEKLKPNGEPANYLTSGLAVTGNHVYWAVRGTYPGIYRCETNGTDPVKLTSYTESGGATMVAFPSALFPEPMASITPHFSYDSSSHWATLAWPSVPNRRYQLLKSADLLQFDQTGSLVNSVMEETEALISSPEPQAFFIIRKLPGIVEP